MRTGVGVAIRIKCGEEEPNERGAIQQLTYLFNDNWALLTSIPRHVLGKEIDACLVGPPGLLVLELKNYRGLVMATAGQHWIVGGVDEMANPIQQAEKCAQRLKTFLSERVHGLDRSIYVDSMVVMTHPECQLDVASSLIRDSVATLTNVAEVVSRRLQRVARDHKWARRPDFDILAGIFRALEIELP